MPAKQNERSLGISTALGEDKVVIVSASITEQLGRLFQMDVELMSDDSQINFQDIIGQNATIRLDQIDGGTRYFNGHVSRFVQTETDQSGAHYRATLVPWLWFLTRTADCRIFQNLSVPDIIKQVMADHGFTDVEDKLNETYQQWECCVQYRETAFNFVSRLMEHEGIYYFFKHEDGQHTLVLADGASSHEAISGDSTIPFRPDTGLRNSEYVHSLVLEQEVLPGSYELNDFNFEKPGTSLLARSENAETGNEDALQIYDYPGEYKEHADGTKYSRIRLEELHSQHETAHAQTNARNIATGNTFELSEAPRADQNRKYLVTAAFYHLAGDEYHAGANEGEELYSCSFTAIDSTRPFRAPRTTPKPLIQGPQTALVVGPAGEEIYADKYGRVKVMFHWDRRAKADENSSCWVRVSQAWAGKGWGAISLPRVGHEVIVEFLEGNPDLPIITGNVYNAEAMPPYDLPANKTMSANKSATEKGSGFNEIRFEDKPDNEQLFIHAERNADVRVKNDQFETIERNRHLKVGNDQLEQVDNDRHEIIKRDHVEKIERDHHLKIDGKEAIEVLGSHSMTVKGDVIEVFKAKHSEQTTNDYYLKADNICIEAMTNVTIKVGGTSIALEAGGIGLKTSGMIKVEGAVVNVTGSGTVAVKGGMVTIN